MIALDKERLIPMREAPKHVPLRPGGKRLHISACYRWITKGIGGVRLESIKLGGTTYTSIEALQRFAAVLSGRESEPPQRHGAGRSPRQSRHVRRVLEAELGLIPGSLGSSPERK